MKRLAQWLPVFVVCIGMVAYANSFGGPFIFDDGEVVTKAPGIHSIFPLPATGRFLYHLSFRFNYAVGGFNPADYHLVNILIHICASLLLYGIVRRTLSLPVLYARYGQAAPWLAATCACIWAVHPVQTESVTYICQRSESMMGLLFLLTFYCFVRANVSTHKRAWYNASIAACAMGMAAKEVMAAAPILLVLYDYIFISGSIREMVQRRGKVHTAMIATWGILFFLCMLSMANNIEAGQHTVACISPLRYLATELGVMTHYLRLAVWPHPLCLDYAWPPAEQLTEILLPGLIMLGLGMGTLIALCRRQPAGYLGSWFFVILGPTSSIIPLNDIAFEHRMYLPLAAIIVLVVTGTYRVEQLILERSHMSGRTILRQCLHAAIVSALLSALVVLTMRRNADYSSAERMWSDVLMKRPDNFRAHASLILALLNRGEYAQAEQRSRTMLARIESFNRTNLRRMSAGASNPEHFYPLAHNHLGRALLGQRRSVEAIDHFETAIQAQPAYKIAHYNLGLAMLVASRTNDAVRACRAALDIDPQYARADALLGFLHARGGNFPQAVIHYQRAVDVAPGLAYAKSELAWLLATCPDNTVRDGATAVTLAETVCRQTSYRCPHTFDVLAAAYAEMGRFADAVRTAERCIRLMNEQMQHRENTRICDPHYETVHTTSTADQRGPSTEIQQRLQLYRTGNAFREELGPSGPALE